MEDHKVKITISLNKKIASQIKTYVYLTPGTTLSSFVEQIIHDFVKEFDIPQEHVVLKRGRPLKMD